MFGGVWYSDFVVCLGNDEYGNLLSSWSSGNGTVSPKTWIGGLSVNDDTADSGMFNMGHRNYAAGVLGRFISRDPIGFSGSSLNLYAYPNPVRFVDPAGLDWTDVAQGVGDTIIGGLIIAGLVAASPVEIPACIAGAVGVGAITYNTTKLATGKEPLTGREIDVHEWDQTAGSLLATPFIIPAGYKGPASVGMKPLSFEMTMVRGVPRYSNMSGGRILNFAVHSNKWGFRTASGSVLSTQEVAAAIRAVPGYRSGMTVRLLSCEGNYMAEELSAELGAQIISSEGGVGGFFPWPSPLPMTPWQTTGP